MYIQTYRSVIDFLNWVYIQIGPDKISTGHQNYNLKKKKIHFFENFGHFRLIIGPILICNDQKRIYHLK